MRPEQIPIPVVGNKIASIHDYNSIFGCGQCFYPSGITTKVEGKISKPVPSRNIQNKRTVMRLKRLDFLSKRSKQGLMITVFFC